MPEFNSSLTYYVGGQFEARFAFDYEGLEDCFEVSIAKHDFPYRQGALLENMGQRARFTRGRCYFLGDNYDTHKILINYLGAELGETGSWELDHPEYGIIKGEIESIVVHHDDRQLTAAVDLVFVEQYRGLIAPKRAPSVQGDTEETYKTGQAQLQDRMAADMQAKLGAESKSILGVALDTSKRYLTQFSNLTAAARSYVAKAQEFVGILGAVCADVANPANSLIATINYATDLPGVVIGTIAQTIERYACLFNTAEAAPSRFLDNLQNAIDDLVATVTDSCGSDYGDYVTVSGAQWMAVELATVLADDAEVASELEAANSQPSFSATGELLKADPSPDLPLTVNEIETSLAIVNTSLAAALHVAREMTSLSSMARTLIEHVSDVKVNRDKVKAVEITSAMPLHLVCLKYGLPYNDAERLLALNRIRHPNFVSGEVLVYER